ncbi:hypothetical protein B0H10DRAFT_2207878 [Mycena sp. CBHHK59/15]|nr:hypothetical protein B0H10DRAFT_2207878 [Mycena sp. CBHHK59/15]
MFRHSCRILLSNASIARRNASTEAPIGVVPGIPPASQTTRIPKTFMSFAMPDVARREHAPQAQIPYLPDFWESSPAKSPAPAEPPLPKLSVVSEVDTHHSHNLHDEHALQDSTTVPVGPRSFGKGGILEDITEDLGIPSPKEIKAGLSKFFSQGSR